MSSTGHADTGIVVRGRQVFQGGRGGLYYLTATGKKASLDAGDRAQFERQRLQLQRQRQFKRNNPNRLTRLPADLISRVAGNLTRANAASLAGASRATRNAVAPRLATNKASVKDQWKRLFQDLRPVMAVLPRQALAYGATIGPLTVTNVNLKERIYHAPYSAYSDSNNDEQYYDRFKVATGARRIDGAWHVIEAFIPYENNYENTDTTKIVITKTGTQPKKRWVANAHGQLNYVPVGGTERFFKERLRISSDSSGPPYMTGGYAPAREAARELGFAS